jgi:hypothetical protein
MSGPRRSEEVQPLEPLVDVTALVTDPARPVATGPEPG